MLKTRTYIVSVLLIAGAAPAGALAASGGEPAAAQIPIGAARSPGIEVLRRPVEQFRQAIEAEVRRLAAEHRAKLRRRGGASLGQLPAAVSLATLRQIAACESGGERSAVSAGGTYRGLYQFDDATWESVGGRGDPAAASAAEQTYRAALLFSRAGSSAWPICG